MSVRDARSRDYPQRLDINWGVFSPDYLHCNGIDYNPETGHIAISSNRTHEIYIIDHDGTFVAGDPQESHRLAASEAGDFLYRFGNPATYGQGEYPHWAKKNWSLQEFSGHKQIGGNHDIQWIEDGLPGAGNLLLFNNGLNVPRGQGDSDPQSEFMELNPYLDANGVDTGHYVNPPQAGYTDVMPGTKDSQGPRATRLFSKQIVSMYHTTDGFNSHHGSAVQRLPNGNTLAQLARVGRMVEVTPEGEVVWEYVQSGDLERPDRDNADHIGSGSPEFLQWLVTASLGSGLSGAGRQGPVAEGTDHGVSRRRERCGRRGGRNCIRGGLLKDASPDRRSIDLARTKSANRNLMPGPTPGGDAMRYTITFAAGLVFAFPAVAHHSDAGLDMDSVVAFEGTVTEFYWRESARLLHRGGDGRTR